MAAETYAVPHAIQSPCPDAVVVNKINVISSSVVIHNSRKFHVLTTCQGFANQWQIRIHYYWYKRQRERCEASGACDMGGFTRILHSGQPDDLMDEVPTLVVDKLPDAALKDSFYVVLNRPFAFQQWLKKVSIPERYVLMAEADHLFLRPMPNMMAGEAPGAALFTYINPDQYGSIVRKFVGDVSDEEVKKIPRIGNSPTMLSVEDLRSLASVWYTVTMGIFNDDEAHKAWNWVLEMYGYALATYMQKQHVGLKTYENFLAHPPWDKKEVTEKGEPFYLLHLTYPMKYNASGGLTEKDEEIVWKFDKRLYMENPPPRNLAQPPETVKSDLARLIISMFNEATDTIPCWDRYVSDKVVTTKC
ncbi:hypothetical protein CEUSTIGMA_g6311.t1 [Chlamydomonas eustigma]|uniref:Hydroxyproline O-arabinosyltransferase-like domain-containing protein n=1 Tax=Chlamydomonas eustigma TaxID=1157962 RepID=A0A250X7K3_9CHLO|nr:hypothetical protein CEUSTIGMA_g6311.t1 [Chlamydomonas eustigma]|eukprot:GAX78872.1 hypothetical protein CEUSTIGMA_g6311.t1 [Chlamydomonas eustigma]